GRIRPGARACRTSISFSAIRSLPACLPVRNAARAAQAPDVLLGTVGGERPAGVAVSGARPERRGLRGGGGYGHTHRRGRALAAAAPWPVLDVVAGLAGHSKSWLSKVERGLLPLERRSDLAALADALQVSRSI